MFSEIMLFDYIRTPLLCVLLMGVAFLTRNASIKKKVVVFAIYEIMVSLLFIWIFILVAVMSECYMESMRSTAEWGGKWIVYFTMSAILQFIIYHFWWKKNFLLKIATLLISLIVVLVPLLF